jgi:GNAT superfamily N-acetyltransferase
VRGRARSYRRNISVFSAVDHFDEASWGDLAHLIGSGNSTTLFRAEVPDHPPPGWRVAQRGRGRQMVLAADHLTQVETVPVRPLTEDDVHQMIDLVVATKPGPFRPDTIRLGGYLGYFEGERLVAMAGQRLSLDGFTEISAVCTHPEVRGRGLASALTYEVATKVLERGDRPFLHVAESNEAARRIYERLGFAQRQLVDFVAVKRTTEEA